MNSIILRSNLFVQWIANPTKVSPCCKRGLSGAFPSDDKNLLDEGRIQ